MNQALLMTVLMGLTFADEVLQSANEMHSTSQTTQLRALLAWRERGKSASWHKNSFMFTIAQEQGAPAIREA